MWCRRAALLLGALLLLGACELRPLYATRAGAVPAALSEVLVAAIPERTGQLLRNRLVEQINPYGQPERPRYRLEVGLNERKEGLAIRQDDSATRISLILVADFRLIELAQGRLAMVGSARTVVGYNIIRSDYSSIVSERDAQRRAAHELADEIKARLSLFLARRPEQTG